MSEYTDERLVDYLLGLERDPELARALRCREELRDRCRALRGELGDLDREVAALLKDEAVDKLARCAWRILLAIDQSPASRAATVAAAALALRTDGVVDVLHVRSVWAAPGVPLPAETRSAATAVVGRALDELRRRGVRAAGRVLCAPPGDVVRHILREADEIGADVIVLGAGTRSWLSGLADPRVAVAVVRKAGCPVFVAR